VVNGLTGALAAGAKGNRGTPDQGGADRRDIPRSPRGHGGAPDGAWKAVVVVDNCGVTALPVDHCAQLVQRFARVDGATNRDGCAAAVVLL
jgi:hypothetical protein